MNHLQLAFSSFLLTVAAPAFAQETRDNPELAAKKLSMGSQTQPKNNPKSNLIPAATAPLRTKAASFLFSQYKQGVLTQNKSRYLVALPNESALAAAHRLKIAYHKLLKYNDLQDGEPLIAYQYIYIEPKKSYFEPAEPAFYKVEKDETMYEIAQFFGLRLADLQQRNGLRPNEEVANGELILLNQRAVARPRLRQSNQNDRIPKLTFLDKKDTNLLQPIKVAEILAQEQNTKRDSLASTATYPDAIYQPNSTPAVSKNQPQQSAATPFVPEQPIPKNPKPQGSVSIFGLPAIVDENE